MLFILFIAYIQADPDGYGTLNGNFTAKESTATELEECSTLNQPQLHKSPYVGHKNQYHFILDVIYVYYVSRLEMTMIMPVLGIAIISTQ